jgi:twitching motility protein PilT
MLSPHIEAILHAAIASGASDILLHLKKPAVLRLHGNLVPLESPPVEATDLDSLWLACGARDGDLDRDASLTAGERFRVNLHHQLGSRGAVLRRIRSDIPALETLGVPAPLLLKWIAAKSGIIIVSGPTGSGKSTTLAALIEQVNQTTARHIVTIEDPVEYLFSGKLSLFTQREVGIDTPTFAEGLRRSLRQNPDIIFLGEIRDAESALTAMQAAETGHLVLTTLHAASCTDVLDRLALLFPPEERDPVAKTLAAQLLGVLCQRLVPATTWARVPACEFFSNVASSRHLIAASRMDAIRDFIARADPREARSFADSLLELVRKGLVEEATALNVCDNPQEFTRALRGVSS